MAGWVLHQGQRDGRAVVLRLQGAQPQQEQQLLHAERAPGHRRRVRRRGMLEGARVRAVFMLGGYARSPVWDSEGY